jgi:hypothetical protein
MVARRDGPIEDCQTLSAQFEYHVAFSPHGQRNLKSLKDVATAQNVLVADLVSVSNKLILGQFYIFTKSHA